jgi:hypothetical protein
MSVDLSDEITAIATAVLSFFAIITAIFAFLAFRKQAQEVSDEATMLKLQYEQLEEQRKINEEQTKVLKLEATELRESIDERKREAAERRRAQASRVFISAEPRPDASSGEPEDPISAINVSVKNTSQQPIYHLTLAYPDGHGEWTETTGFDRVILMPDEQYQRTFSMQPSISTVNFYIDTAVVTAAVVFRDAAGVHWRLYADGRLDEEPVTDQHRAG